jgi:Ca2+-binding EF-hand superfamily protein
MRITRNQLRQLIREALEIHHTPEEAYDYIDTFPEEYSNLDRTNITKDEAFSAGCSVCGSQARDDCDHKEYSSMVKPDDPDLDDDGFLSVAELVNMVHRITDDVSLESSPPMSSMVEPLMRAIAASPPEGLTAEDLRDMSDETREELRLKLAQAAAHVEHAVRDALRRG